MHIHDRIKERIRAVATAQGISYRAWSEAAGLGPNSVSQFLNGSLDRSIYIETLQQLADAVSVPLITLIADAEAPVDIGLLETILELTLATHPDPKAHPGTVAKVVAATYSAAVDQGIGSRDRQSLKLAAKLLSRESSSK